MIHKINPPMEVSNRQKLVRSIVNTSYLIKRQQENILSRFHLNLSKFNILEILLNEYPVALSQNQIRAKLTDKTIDLPRIAKNLDENCFVSRSRNKENKTIAEITITPKGIQTMNEIYNCSEEMSRSTIELTDTEVEQALDALKKIADATTETTIELSIAEDDDDEVVYPNGTQPE